MRDLLKCNGFTLAEVLVTLGIIGVISAMTLPTLVKNHQRTVYVTQLQKVVNELSQAAERAVQESNALTLTETPYKSTNNNAAQQFLSKYLKVIQTCTTDRAPCMASEYKQLNGTNFNAWAFEPSNQNPCVSIASGAAICMSGGFSMDQYSDGQYSWHDYGPQGPNILGRDLFYAELYSDGRISESYTSSHQADYCVGNDIGYGVGCLTKVMVDGWKMDY